MQTTVDAVLPLKAKNIYSPEERILVGKAVV